MTMFHWVELRAYCHATEDEEKVVAALRTILPAGDLKREAVGGHFGNPLVSLAVRTERAPEMRDVWRRILEALGTDEALHALEDRVDEDGVYHLRLDKQAAFQGRIERPYSADVIDLRAKVAAFPKKREVAIELLRASAEAP